jgi:hypothetical protein
MRLAQGVICESFAKYSKNANDLQMNCKFVV